jgi:sulfur-oxidizing protein SoxY
VTSITRKTATTRRRFLTVAGGVFTGAFVGLRHAGATPASMAAAIHQVTGEASVQPGKVRLEVPPLVENGNTVSLTVSVASPMSAADHVKSIHIFNEKNPQPNVAAFHIGPRAGRARVSTRIRLADSQTIIAIARMSDGSLWSAKAEVIVTLAACVEDL